MKGGCDKGFCFSYFSLSYRRKFIRTIWASVIFTPIAVMMMTQLPSLAGWPTYALTAFMVVGSVLQATYNYRRWRAENDTKQSVR
jgi:hypothetical protein